MGIITLALASTMMKIETVIILKMMREEEENHPHDDGVESSSSFSAERGGISVSEKITIVQRS